MKMNVNVILGTVFVIIATVFYFTLLPGSFYYSKNHGPRKWSAKYEAKRPDYGDLKTSGTSGFAKSPLQVAKDIFQKHGVVLFAMINDAFFPFAASWCCNTEQIGGVHERVLFLSTDLETGHRLKRLWPSLSVAAINGTQYSGEQTYSRAGYVRMMVERTRYILRLLQAGVRLLLFEVDCLWLSDPVPQLMARRAEGDILATRVSERSAIIAGGFLLLNPSPATLSLWQRLAVMMEDLQRALKDKERKAAVPETQNDQRFFTALVRKGYAGVKLVYLSPDLYPDGKWYRLQEKERSAKPRPIIINNNWVIGKRAKIKRAKSFEHWFWNDVGEGSCNYTALRNLFI